MKFFKKFLAISLILSMMQSNVVIAASKYSDVAENHWAYSAIVSVAEKGYMVGTISNEYKPDNPIDKFETSKILAMAAGYKYSNITAEESAAYTTVYNHYKSVLDVYKATYIKWSTNADREVAYLLSKGIYDVPDLDLFILKSGDKENLRALSRQEAAAYLVKLMGRKEQALAYSYPLAFADDAKISTEYRPYVYYLKSIGIISGEANNTFNPNGAVTRAAFAVMLDKTIKLGVNVGSSALPLADLAQTQTNTSSLIDTISGTIEKVHTSLNAVQVRYTSGETKIHKLDATSIIYIDSAVKTIYDLQEGMPIIGLIKNNVAIDIKAQSVKSPAQAAPSSTNTSSSQPSASTSIQPAVVEYRILRGTITEIRFSSAKTVTIEVRIINPLGGIIVEREEFKVEDDCYITRGGRDIMFSSIKENDVVKAKVYAGKAYSLELEEKDRRMNVVVIDKKTEATLGTNFYVVEDAKGDIHELVVSNESQLTRKGFGKVSFTDVRIGDSLDLLAEYSVIKEAYAYGTQGYMEGTISEVHLTKGNSYLVLIDSGNKATKYNIISGVVDVYALRVNSRVRLKLDSKEVESVSLLEEPLNNYYTGYIDTITTHYITLRNTQSGAGTVRVYFDSATAVTDSVAAQRVNINSLYRDMKVYVMFKNSTNEVAGSITILSK